MMTSDSQPTPVADPLFVIVLHLDHTLRSLRRLPMFARDDQPPCVLRLADDVRVACLESFYMHARLIGDFFFHGRADIDYTPRDFIENFSMSEDAQLEVDRVWQVASRQIAHVSRARIIEEGETAEDTSLEGLLGIQRACEVAFTEFVEACESSDAPYATQLRAVLNEAPIPLGGS